MQTKRKIQELLQSPDFPRDWVHKKRLFTLENAVTP